MSCLKSAQKRYKRTAIHGLRDWYVKEGIRVVTGEANIPGELVSAKREYLRVKRLLKGQMK